MVSISNKVLLVVLSLRLCLNVTLAEIHMMSKGYPLCITFNLYDTFGDNWNSAKLQITDEHGHDSLHDPKLGERSAYCFDTDTSKAGQTVTAGVLGLQPKFSWEVYWTATLDGNNGIVYMGTYNTFMTFEFIVENNEEFGITLKSSSNILKKKEGCNTCSAVEPITTFMSEGSSTVFTKSATVSSTDPAHSQHGDEHNPDKLKRILSETALYELLGDSRWHSLNGYGTTFDISSIDGLTRYYTGGLCLEENSRESKDNKNAKKKGVGNGKKSSGKSCDLSKLTPGEYRWRVSGAYDEDRNDVSWKFCGVEGGASTEVLFAIDDLGQCTPLKTHIYDGSDVTTVERSSDTNSFRGTFWTINANAVINGLDDSKSAAEHASKIPSLIQDILNSITIDNGVGVPDAKDVSVTSWSPSKLATDSTPDIKFTFEVTLIPESYGYDSSESGVVSMHQLADRVQSYIQASIDSGIFLKELTSHKSSSRSNHNPRAFSSVSGNTQQMSSYFSTGSTSYSVSGLVLGLAASFSALGAVLLLVHSEEFVKFKNRLPEKFEMMKTRLSWMTRSSDDDDDDKVADSRFITMSSDIVPVKIGGLGRHRSHEGLDSSTSKGMAAPRTEKRFTRPLIHTLYAPKNIKVTATSVPPGVQRADSQHSLDCTRISDLTTLSESISPKEKMGFNETSANYQEFLLKQRFSLKPTCLTKKLDAVSTEADETEDELFERYARLGIVPTASAERKFVSNAPKAVTRDDIQNRRSLPADMFL